MNQQKKRHQSIGLTQQLNFFDLLRNEHLNIFLAMCASNSEALCSCMFGSIPPCNRNCKLLSLWRQVMADLLWWFSCIFNLKFNKLMLCVMLCQWP